MDGGAWDLESMGSSPNSAIDFSCSLEQVPAILITFEALNNLAPTTMMQGKWGTQTLIHLPNSQKWGSQDSDALCSSAQVGPCLRDHGRDSARWNWMQQMDFGAPHAHFHQRSSTCLYFVELAPTWDFLWRKVLLLKQEGWKLPDQIILEFNETLRYESEFFWKSWLMIAT